MEISVRYCELWSHCHQWKSHRLSSCQRYHIYIAIITTKPPNRYDTEIYLAEDEPFDEAYWYTYRISSTVCVVTVLAIAINIPSSNIIRYSDSTPGSPIVFGRIGAVVVVERIHEEDEDIGSIFGSIR